MSQQKQNLFSNSNRIKEIRERKKKLSKVHPQEILEEVLLVKAIHHLIHSLLFKKRPLRTNIVK
jgi:phosphopantetheine adenylyltransferase